MTIEYATIVESSDIPEPVEEEMRKIWREQELGNDFYYFGWDADELDYTEDWENPVRCGDRFPNLQAYIEANVPEDKRDRILLHFWW